MQINLELRDSAVSIKCKTLMTHLHMFEISTLETYLITKYFVKVRDYF